MKFKVYKVNHFNGNKEEDTGIIVEVNPDITSDLDALAKEFGTMYVCANGDDKAPDYLWGFKVFWDDEGFEQDQTDYIFRLVEEEEVR